MIGQKELVITKAVHYLEACLAVFNSPIFGLVTQSSIQLLRYNVEQMAKFM
jgi:hypothetical protein